MHRMLADAQPPTAVFCANDIQAIGALAECRDVGLDVPRDISIIGFDDLPVAPFTVPQLTTIRVPAQRMGQLAASRLIEWIRDRRPPAMEELPVELIVRGTTGPAAKARGRNDGI